MSLVSILIVMFDVMFWIFRVVVAVTTTLNIDIGFIVPDLTAEIVMLFIALFCLIFIVRKSLLAAVLYVISYVWYFGVDIYNAVMQVQDGQALTAMQGLNVFIALIGVILAVATLVDIALSKNKKGTATDKKTDWFYKNEQFDRQFDERADRNNYKF